MPCKCVLVSAGHPRVKSASTSLMWVGAAEHVETNKTGSGRDMQPWKLQETSLDLLPWRGGRQSPCPSEEGRHWALSGAMCPGWLVPCLIYV